MDIDKPRSQLSSFIRPDLQHLAGYTPVVPVERLVAESRSAPVTRPLKLDANENPYGPSPRVLKAISESEALQAYPDAEQRTLRAALANYVGLNSEHVVVGNGSDEVLDMIVRLIIQPGDKVLNCTPTFGMYKFVTEVAGGILVEVERNERYGLDLDALERTMDDRTKLVFIASPNNPTGNTASRDEIISLLGMGVFVVIDEAYYEFSGHTVSDLVQYHENLMVVRTFSKWAGLAGVRIGYGLVSPTASLYINQIKQPYNVSLFAQIAALESLKDVDHLMDNVRAIVSERDRLFGLLEGLDYLTPIPSEGNYILCRVAKGRGKQVYELLKQLGVFVRYYDRINLEDCLRISVGKPDEMDILMEALRAVGDQVDG